MTSEEKQLLLKDLCAKIRHEIERLKKENDNIKCDSNKAYCQGYGDAFVDLLDFLDTLSEKPDKSLEEEYMDYVVNDPVYTKLVNRIAGLGIARHFAEWGAEHLKK